MTASHRPTVAAIFAAAAAMTAATLILAACSNLGVGQPSPAGPSAGTSSSGAAAPSSAAGPSDADACTLITEQDVTETLGSDPGPGTPIAHAGSSQCQYGSYATQAVLVNVTPSQGKQAFDNFRKDPHTADAGAVVDVDQIGDRAFEVGSHGSAGIFFVKGEVLVVVSVVVLADASPPMDQAVALAKTVASRI